MPAEPPVKRATAFIDAQNLFHAAKEAFGNGHPNFDPLKLARVVCQLHAWTLAETRLYTGVPAPADNAFWNHFWTAKLAQMGREGIVTYARARGALVVDVRKTRVRLSQVQARCRQGVRALGTGQTGVPRDDRPYS